MSELVSIITPLYNSEKYIPQTIESVLSQTYQNWEMIIIDDCSNDNSVDIIEEYCKKDNRIKLLRSKKNNGPAIARNIGIEQAKGIYIAFLDSDDLWYKQKLEKQIRFMKENKLVVTCSSYDVINKDGKIINTRIVKQFFSYQDMLKTNHIGNLTGIYNCKKIGKIFMQNVGHEDYIFWLQVMHKANSTRAIVEPLAAYRLLNKSISANKFKALGWQWNIYRKYLKLNFSKSLYYFYWYTYYALKKRL